MSRTAILMFPPAFLILLLCTGCEYLDTIDTITDQAYWNRDPTLYFSEDVQAVRIDGLPQDLLCPQDSSVTVEVWFYPFDTGKPWLTLPLFSRQACGYGCTIYQADDPITLYKARGDGNTNGYEVLFGHGGFTETWHHLAWVIAPGYEKKYLDGVFVEREDNTGYNIGSTAASLLIGASVNFYRREYQNTVVHSYRGCIKDLAVFDHERSATQIEQDFATPLTGGEAGLLGLWKLNEGEGQAAGDSSPSGNHGYLGSAAGEDAHDPVWTEILCVPENEVRPILQFGEP